jgi:hypothetical protein
MSTISRLSSPFAAAFIGVTAAAFPAAAETAPGPTDSQLCTFSRSSIANDMEALKTTCAAIVENWIAALPENIPNPKEEMEVFFKKSDLQRDAVSALTRLASVAEKTGREDIYTLWQNLLDRIAAINPSSALEGARIGNYGWYSADRKLPAPTTKIARMAGDNIVRLVTQIEAGEPSNTRVLSDLVKATIRELVFRAEGSPEAAAAYNRADALMKKLGAMDMGSAASLAFATARDNPDPQTAKHFAQLYDIYEETYARQDVLRAFKWLQTGFELALTHPLRATNKRIFETYIETLFQQAPLEAADAASEIMMSSYGDPEFQNKAWTKFAAYSLEVIRKYPQYKATIQNRLTYIPAYNKDITDKWFALVDSINSLDPGMALKLVTGATDEMYDRYPEMAEKAVKAFERYAAPLTNPHNINYLQPLAPFYNAAEALKDSGAGDRKLNTPIGRAYFKYITIATDNMAQQDPVQAASWVSENLDYALDPALNTAYIANFRRYLQQVKEDAGQGVEGLQETSYLFDRLGHGYYMAQDGKPKESLKLVAYEFLFDNLQTLAKLSDTEYLEVIMLRSLDSILPHLEKDSPLYKKGEETVAVMNAELERRKALPAPLPSPVEP